MRSILDNHVTAVADILRREEQHTREYKGVLVARRTKSRLRPPPPPPPPPLWCYRPLTLNSPCNPDTPVTRMVRRNQLARTPLKTKLYELDDARVCYTRRPLHSTFGTENVGGSGKTQGENVNGVVSRQGVWASA